MCSLAWGGEPDPDAWCGVSKALAQHAAQLRAEACGPDSDVVALSGGRFIIDPEGNLSKSRDRMLDVVKGLADGDSTRVGERMAEASKTASKPKSKKANAKQVLGFARFGRWEGHAGTTPHADWMLQALSTDELVLYCGHGAGEKCVGRDAVLARGGLAIARSRARAETMPWDYQGTLERDGGASAASGRGEGKAGGSEASIGAPVVLSGCSSARLRVDGVYAPSGLALAYSLGWHRHVFGNLWEVTDKELDGSVGALLGGLASGSPWSVASGAAQDACRLRNLTSAAQVHYGVPLRSLSANAEASIEGGWSSTGEAGSSGDGDPLGGAKRQAGGRGGSGVDPVAAPRKGSRSSKAVQALQAGLSSSRRSGARL